MAGINPLSSALYNTDYLFGTVISKKQTSVSQLWNTYNSAQSNALQSLSGLTEINTNLKSVLSSYDDAKAAFSSEFKENMSELSASAAKIKGYDFSVEQDGAITTTTQTDKDGNVSSVTNYSKELQAAIDTVKDFVSDYNSAVKFFGDNSSVSKRVEIMSNTFSDTTYRASAYASIGLTVSSDGSLSVNEAQLAQTIVDDPNKVSSILGKDGLAGKAENHISFANSQEDKLFPTAEKMLGNQLETASIYTGSAYRNMAAMSYMGNLINMMF